jgi:predicted HTH transcriptional regulator
LKGVVGFLNTDGGVLLIGVDDNGEVTGIGRDNFQNEDKCLRHIDNLINQHIGPEYLQFIRYGLVDIRGEKVVMIRCARSNDPAFLKNKKEEEDFFVRTGPASRKLTPSQILKYLEARRGG